MKGMKKLWVFVYAFTCAHLTQICSQPWGTCTLTADQNQAMWTHPDGEWEQSKSCKLVQQTGCWHAMFVGFINQKVPIHIVVEFS